MWLFYYRSGCWVMLLLEDSFADTANPVVMWTSLTYAITVKTDVIITVFALCTSLMKTVLDICLSATFT